MQTLLVTGGAGFIGTNFVYAARTKGYRVVNLDKLTYAGNIKNLDALRGDADHKFIQGDIGDETLITRIFAEEKIDAVVHFAAESHVDRSIDAPGQFIDTNIKGTFTLLHAALNHWKLLNDAQQQRFRFLHVSTDEVYGSLGDSGLFTEETAYAPNSPYSASKAASDHLVRAYFHTYGLPCLTTNCSNNYGPWQFPEKLIPVVLLNALKGKPIPIYGDGKNVRDWLYVVDHCEAILRVLEAGQTGQTYNIGGHNEMANMEVVRTICSLLDARRPKQEGHYADQITFVKDRPGHDRRYAIDAGKIQRELGWSPRESFATGMEKTVDWYLSHLDWCEDILSGGYRLERIGLGQDQQDL